MIDFLQSKAVAYTAGACMLAVGAVLPLIFDKLKYAGVRLGLSELAAILWFCFTLTVLVFHVEQLILERSTFIKLTFAVINVFLATCLLHIKIVQPTLESKKKSG